MSKPNKRGAELISDKVKTLPAATGVYRMIGGGGKILYIGKARDLKKRVAQYVNLSRHSQRIQRMIILTREMEFTLTPSEPEALLLEARMIKRHHPPFNIIFRDDKSFPFIELNHQHEAARLSKYREQPGRKRGEQCEYFGPFVSADAVDRTLIALQRAFLLRSCTDHVYAHRARPCLLYQIKRCAAPCTGEISLAAYQKLADQAREFLRGASRDVQKNLTRQMDKAAAAEDYEIAALYRDRLRALQQIQTQPGRHLSPNMDADLFAIHHEKGASCIQLFIIRSGQNLGNHAWFPKHHAQDEAAAILQSFIAQFYTHRRPAPEIISNLAMPEVGLLAEALTLKAERKVRIIHPKQGAKKNLIENAEWNARSALARHHAEIANQKDMLAALAKKLNLRAPPKRIEIYDNSHIQGSAPVGAMVVAGEEGFMKAHYRLFNIKPEKLKAGDDYAMMRQVFARRFRKKNQTAILPDLIIIDGGLGQMGAVKDIIAALGKAAPAMLGIAKGEARRRTSAQERFFFNDKALALAADDPLRYYLQRLRDEAHRFAITRHRARRKKTALASPLDDIVGIGARRKRSLLSRFGSAKRVAHASLEELTSVEGISKKRAQVIYDHFHTHSL